MRTLPLLVPALILAATSCAEAGGGPTDSPTTAQAPPTTTSATPSSTPASSGSLGLPDRSGVDQPHEVHFYVLTEQGEQLELDWWTACLSFPSAGEAGVSVSMCADGVPPTDPPSVGSPETVRLGFTLPGWRFKQADFAPHGEQRATSAALTTPIERTGARTFVVPAPDRPGDYDVTVFGRGPEGDAVTTFRWVVR